MQANTVTCPTCQALLQIGEAAASGRALVQCPACATQFSATDASGDLSSPGEPSFRRPLIPALLVAGVGALVLVGAAAAGLYFLTPETPPARPVAAHPPAATAVVDKHAADNDKQQAQYIQLMVQAGLAQKQHHFEDAIKLYQNALALKPDDADAKAGLRDARKGLDAATVARTAEDKRQGDFKHYMQQGKDAVAGKQYASAVRAYQAALDLVPGNTDAVGALADAREQLTRDEQEKKKLAEYEDHMTAGRAAMVDQRYADAVREFLAAQRRVPSDAAAARGLQDAEQRMAQLQDEGKRRATYVRLMTQGGAAIKNGRYQEAVTAYKTALKLVPNDPSARRGLRDAEKGLKDAKTQYTQLMSTGTTALQLNNIPAAVQAFQQAAQLLPNDQAALLALRQAQQLVANAATLQTVANNAQLGYQELMATGTAALFGQHYRLAARAFTNVLSLFPGDPQAMQGLFQAQAGLATRVRNQPTFAQQLRRGNDAFRRQQYADAVAAYTQALQLTPNDPRALALLAQANYSLHMANGQTAMLARRFHDAVREFRAALRQAPRDALALNALRQASLLAR